MEELETSARMVNHGTKVTARHNWNSQCRISRENLRAALPCGSLAEQLSRQDQSVGHLAGALACLEVGDPLDADASQVDRLDVHSRDGLQDGPQDVPQDVPQDGLQDGLQGGLQGIQGLLEAAACLGNLGVEVHPGSPEVGHLALAYPGIPGAVDGLAVPDEPSPKWGSSAASVEVAASGKSSSELPVLCFALKSGCCLHSGSFFKMEGNTSLEVLLWGNPSCPQQQKGTFVFLSTIIKFKEVLQDTHGFQRVCLPPPSSSWSLQIWSCMVYPCSLLSPSSSCFSPPRTQSLSHSRALNGPPT